MASLIDKLTRLLPARGPLASPFAQRVFLGVVLVGATAFPLLVQTPPIDLVEGQPSPRTIRANRTVQFIDEKATARARAEAAASVGQVAVHDTEAVERVRGHIMTFFDSALDVLGASVELTGTPEQVRTATHERLRKRLPEADQALILAVAEMDPATLQAARTSALQISGTLLSRRFDADEIPSVLQQLQEDTNRLAYKQSVRDLIARVVGSAIEPTVVVDERATDAARKAAAEQVNPIVIVKQAGENIVVEGEVVKAEDIEIIRRLGLLEQSGSLLSRLALVGVYFLMIAAGGAFVWRYDRAVWDSLRDLLIMAVLVGGMMWATRMVLWWRPEVSVYLLPVPLAAMLATLLLSAREGLIVAVLTSLSAVLLGVSSDASAVGTLVWATSGVVAVSFMTDRRALFGVGVALVVSGALIGFVATLASGLPMTTALNNGMFGAVGGLLSAVLGYGLLPFFEHAFGVTTDIRLLELVSPAHPLLRELMVAAPGTYSHSIMTGNLAEAAAEAIGANPLLARVGAYYHDVGKLRRPSFFVENQAGAANPHDGTLPSLSALIITAHVREGIELGKEYRLPTEVIDIIRQHHGTSLVSYFFNKASEGGTPVYEADFRYDGQRPQSPEAALVMLADSAEAAARSVKKPTQARIESAVRTVVDGKVADGQLDDARLTLADIETVIRVYSRMLAAVHHPRVEYPEQKARRLKHAHTYHQSSRP